MNNLKQHILEFLQASKEQRGLSDNTIKSYQQDLVEFSRFLENQTPQPAPSQKTVMDYLRHMREEKNHKPATVRRRMVTLRRFFDWRISEHGTASPFSGLKLDLRIPKRLPHPVDRQTLQQLFRHATPLVNLATEEPAKMFSTLQVTGLATRILVATGLRIGELTHLKLNDVSGASSRIRVIGKGDRERTVYVTNERLLIDLTAYWQQRVSNSLPSDFLFLNGKGERLTEAAFRKRLRATSRNLQLGEHLTPHRFRHSAATLLIEEGVDIRIVQRLLGHASIATTELYTQVSDNSLFAAIERADALGSVDSWER